jgi:hypothetical protein
MNARDLVFGALKRQGFKSSKTSIDYLFSVIEKEGFVILLRSEVEAIKEYLYITTRYGTEGYNFYLKLKEGLEIDYSECADDQETRIGDAA